MNYLSEKDIYDIITSVVSKKLEESKASGLKDEWMSVPVEVSARHVHLTKEAIAKLFGEGYKLTRKRDLSQPGQFLSEERVKVVTSKGTIENVAVLGPARKYVQVELSITDARSLGLKPPIRQSGDLAGACDVYIVGPKGMIEAKSSAIVAKAHVHMTPSDALKYGVKDSELVDVKIGSERELILSNVLVRVSEQSKLAVHIDYDEANAALFSEGDGSLRKKDGCCTKTKTADKPVEKKKTTLGKKYLITEKEAKDIISRGGCIPDESECIITPAARDVFLHSNFR